MNGQAAAHGPPAYRPSIDAFERGDIDPAAFDHSAHVYVAWAYLAELPLLEAIARFCRSLERLTRQLGAEQKYHETISWFFMIQVAERRHGAAARDWDLFAAENPDLLQNAGDCLRRFYSESRLSSPQARRLFLLPDLAPAPGAKV